jgi:GNAT superfamily N-acetyltransferase
VSARAFEFDISDPARAARWQARVGHLLATDPEGGFVAVHEGRIVGVAQAMLREGLGCLSLLTVDPEAQSAGAGHALLDATLDYGRTERRGAIIVSSNDARALTLYARAGFMLRPTLAVSGVPPELPPPAEPVRAVPAHELDALAPISRALRGAAHTPELRFELQARDARVLALEDRGFVVSTASHAVWLLAARDEPAAESLLRAALRRPTASGEIIGWMTGEQTWAQRAVTALGLRLRTMGALCVQGEVGPLVPYLPSPAYG